MVIKIQTKTNVVNGSMNRVVVIYFRKQIIEPDVYFFNTFGCR